MYGYNLSTTSQLAETRTFRDLVHMIYPPRDRIIGEAVVVEIVDA